MDSARREQSGSPSDSIGIAGAAISAFDALDTPGHHDVRIFGLPRNQLIMLSVSSLLFMLPLAILVGMLPFWERVGDFFF